MQGLSIGIIVGAATTIGDNPGKCITIKYGFYYVLKGKYPISVSCVIVYCQIFTRSLRASVVVNLQ